jgi:hypothetical protein
MRKKNPSRAASVVPVSGDIVKFRVAVHPEPSAKKERRTGFMNIRLCKFAQTSVSRGVAAVIGASALLCAGVASAGAAPSPLPVPLLTTHVAAVSAPMANTPASATNAVSECPVGTKLVGGGIRVGKASPTDTTTPTNGLKVNGTYPSDVSGTPVANHAIDPSFWTAAGGFATQSEAGDQVTSFAVCASVGPVGSVDRVVEVASVPGPTAAEATASVTATCPAGTTLVGGGALGTPANSPSFKPVGSYPSNDSGTMLTNGATNPQSWTVVGSAGGTANPANVTTAFAVCSKPLLPILPLLQTAVVRVDAPGPTAASTFTTVPATCTGTRLLSGGVNVDNPTGELQSGVHLRGSYPSDTTGNPVSNGAVNPTAWTGLVQVGGTPAPGTVTHTFAVCARLAVL